MSYKIGHRHVHARDAEGYTGCHHEACQCARCLLEAGAEIPRDRRADVADFREHTSEMYKCEKCGGLRLSLLNGDPKHKIPTTLWCMTCGNTQFPKGDEEDRPSRRLAQDSTTGKPKPKAGPSLRERLASNSHGLGNGGGRTAVSSGGDGPRRDWTPEERRDLKKLIDKHGIGTGIKQYLASYPDRGRTKMGCAYQWNVKISKGEGI